MKKRTRISLCLIIIGLAFFAWMKILPKLWLPAYSSKVTVDRNQNSGAKVVKSPNDDRRFILLNCAADDTDIYIIDIGLKQVQIPNLSYWSFCGLVLQKESQLQGVPMTSLGEKPTLDPELKIGERGKSFSFRTETGHMVSVTGL